MCTRTGVQSIAEISATGQCCLKTVSNDRLETVGLLYIFREKSRKITQTPGHRDCYQLFKVINGSHPTLHMRGRAAQGPCRPTFLAYLVILCFEKRCPKHSIVARLKSKSLAPQKNLGWLRHCHLGNIFPLSFCKHLQQVRNLK